MHIYAHTCIQTRGLTGRPSDERVLITGYNVSLSHENPAIMREHTSRFRSHCLRLLGNEASFYTPRARGGNVLKKIIRIVYSNYPAVVVTPKINSFI